MYLLILSNGVIAIASTSAIVANVAQDNWDTFLGKIYDPRPSSGIVPVEMDFAPGTSTGDTTYFWKFDPDTGAIVLANPETEESKQARRDAIQADITALEVQETVEGARGRREFQLTVMEEVLAPGKALRDGITAQEALDASPYYVALKALDEVLKQKRRDIAAIV